MDKYVVVTKFRDTLRNKELQIPGHPYDVTGLDEERIEYLTSPVEALNGEVAIKLVETNEYPKHTGGGWYELSDGTKVQGKEEAYDAEKGLITDGED